MTPEFNSVRAINKACQDAAYGRLGGKYIYFRRATDTPGQSNLVRISRARTAQGLLFVRHRGEWHRCQFKDVVSQ